MEHSHTAHRVQEAMAATDRRAFLPEHQQRFADSDQPLTIGHGATCSQPTTVREMLTLLDARPGHRVLDVGSGSGWTTAILAALVAPDGAVFGVELEPALVEFGSANLTAWVAAQKIADDGGAHLDAADDATRLVADDGATHLAAGDGATHFAAAGSGPDAPGSVAEGDPGGHTRALLPLAPATIEAARPSGLGLPDHAPFDRILVSAEARALPMALVDQLADGGRMVAPVRGALAVADVQDSELHTRSVGAFSFVPLRGPGSR